MKYINRVELLGVVGKRIRINTVNEVNVASFTLVTDRLYLNKENGGVEVANHTVVVWDNDGIWDFSKIEEGAIVHVTGHIKYHNYIGDDGLKRRATEIMASTFQVLGKKDDDKEEEAVAQM